ncbi:hypothetical protein BIU97_04545 [Curtobacterium sp. MCBA15_009]|uniref:class III lanthionine synthetase LanKC n=1 Tax=Curtobacterium sp. MCBA15_009 TaxID=1898737 RepID=UPI0008DC62B6|nr:class III lanthionine synthetase LanKC [Curtobacterium sp. MCBA15_009]OII11189.1 hypothetical protein BIU97_04545 [Curtobacterium sp. MCBA15_009]
MDFRYLRYLQADESVYVNPVRPADQLHVLPEPPDGWEVRAEEHWTYVFVPGASLPAQGWKIHITAPASGADETLDRIAPVLYQRGTPFKFVGAVMELLLKNSKYGDRSSSGKFVTVYPRDDDDFVELLDVLDTTLAGMPAGPYVLSDRRWRSGNVSYRYGGFVEQRTSGPDGGGHLGITDPDGNVVRDDRAPVYSEPDFVEEPAAVRRVREQLEATSDDAEMPYDVHSALHHSNGGGVYRATRSTDGLQVVLKEARPGAGLDGQGRDAVARLAIEADVLRRLDGSPWVPRIHDEFSVWEHRFIAEDYVEGTTLNSWTAAFYPFGRDADVGQFTSDACRIVRQARAAMVDVHARGVGLGDLQPANIMISTDGEVRLIDFEAASDLDDEVHSGLMTVGFAAPPGSSREGMDWFALARIARFVFLPVGPTIDLAPELASEHDRWIEEQFGAEPVALIRDIEARAAALTPAAAGPLAPSQHRLASPSDMRAVTESLREGLLDSLVPDTDRLAPGDIRQYENRHGRDDVATGAAGVVLALSRTGGVPDEARLWLIEAAQRLLGAGADTGLFSGSAGVAGVLLELGLIEEARPLLERVAAAPPDDDVAIRSGSAGRGLLLLQASELAGLGALLAPALSVADDLLGRVERHPELRVEDPDGVPIGLIDGWAGVALFLTACSRVSTNRAYLDGARRAIEHELDICVVSRDGMFQVKEDARVIPYLAGGSAGLAVAIASYRARTGSDEWEDELHGIGVTTQSRCYYSPGLFRGASGLITAAAAVDTALHLDGASTFVPRAVRTLELYLLRRNGFDVVPGDFSYRLSFDLSTGSAGALLALHEAAGRPLGWLPVPNADRLLPARDRATVPSRAMEGGGTDEEPGPLAAGSRVAG